MHYVFGAVAFGVVVARSASTDLRRRVARRVGSLGAEMLLPVYFVTTGLRVDLPGMGPVLGVLGALLVVAILTKATGAYAGARLGGLPRRDSTTMAVLMNTRGLTEIVVLTAGLQLGIIDGRFYSAMAVMAVVTTAMTAPLLTLLDRRGARGGLSSTPPPADTDGRTPMTEHGEAPRNGPDPDQDEDPRTVPPPDVPESPQVVALDPIDSRPEGGCR